MEHRASTRARHLTLFLAVPFVSFHVRFFLSSSAILVRLQVCWGLPLFRFPCGFHSSALLATCPSGLLNVWPIHPQALCLISCSIGRCPVCLQSSLLLETRALNIHSRSHRRPFYLESTKLASKNLIFLSNRFYLGNIFRGK